MFWLYFAALFPITLLGVVILYDSVTAHLTARRKRAPSPQLLVAETVYRRTL
jgi:hypothetical protein